MTRVRILVGAGKVFPPLSLSLCQKPALRSTQFLSSGYQVPFTSGKSGQGTRLTTLSSAKVKNMCPYTSTPSIHLHRMVLSEMQGSLCLFTFRICKKLPYIFSESLVSSSLLSFLLSAILYLWHHHTLGILSVPVKPFCIVCPLSSILHHRI
jgi:hypothetical protein